ncbi:MAG TPA: peptidylprolyl isomerase [Nitrospiraceae bacterium]|nr:peptidylprolyl isomerase [Nitrospiraceae bacterium]
MKHNAVCPMMVGLLMASWLSWGESAHSQNAQVADGMEVSLEYTLTLPDKTVLDSNVGRVPISFVQGQHQVVSGLEKALTGMTVGQQKTVEVSPEQGYGPYDKAARATVDKSKVPADLKAGMMLRSANGQPVTVLEVTDKMVVLDLNHPLAGKHLIFDVKVVNVKKPDSPPPAGPAR